MDSLVEVGSNIRCVVRRFAGTWRLLTWLARPKLKQIIKDSDETSDPSTYSGVSDDSVCGGEKFLSLPAELSDDTEGVRILTLKINKKLKYATN